MELNYAELMRRAEQAKSRGEAIHFINCATRLKEQDEFKQFSKIVGR